LLLTDKITLRKVYNKHVPCSSATILPTTKCRSLTHARLQFAPPSSTSYHKRMKATQWSVYFSFGALVSSYSKHCVHAIAEAVSRWLPTTAARVQSRVWSSGICGGRSGVGAGFLRVLRIPLPFIPPNSLSSQSPGAGTIGQQVADVPSGPSLDSTPQYAIKKKILITLSITYYFAIKIIETIK
jgi:hypothetical protein